MPARIVMMLHADVSESLGHTNLLARPAAERAQVSVGAITHTSRRQPAAGPVFVRVLIVLDRDATRHPGRSTMRYGAGCTVGGTLPPGQFYTKSTEWLVQDG